MSRKLIVEEFDSINRMLAILASRDDNTVFSGRSKSSCETGDRDFYGTDNWDESENLLRFGWAEHVTEILDTISGTLKADEGIINKRRPINSVVGFAPNVPNAIRGLPESMISATSTKQKVKAITIVYNHSVIASWSTSDILKAGITVLKLVNQIERRNIRVKLVSEFKSSQSDKEIGIARVVLKDFKDQLDIKKITFPFAHSSMQRRIGFKWLETCPDIADRGWRSGYGSSLGDVMDYERIVKLLKDNNHLKDNEYYITAALARSLNFDVDRLIQELEIKM